MHRYAAFGFNIQSMIELPELAGTRSDCPLTWQIRVESGVPAIDPGIAVGSDFVYDGVEVRGFTTASGARLEFDDTGTFDVHAAERAIVWSPGPRATEAAVRADLLGRVIALAAHVDGCISLHASAASIDGQAVAFLGPKRAGKSTLALALARRGARLLTDDTLVVRIDAHGSPSAAPGVQRVRLWEDAARALGAVTSSGVGSKPTVDCLTPDEREPGEVPLVACYVLSADDGDIAVPARRERLPPVQAAVACVRFSKLGGLAGGTVGQTMLDRIVHLTRTMPVFQAAVRRDLAALDDVAALILEWHRLGVAAGAER